MPFTSYFEKKLLDHALNVASYTPPASYSLSLHTASPGPTGSHAAEISTSGTGYARQSLAGKFGAADATSGISINTAAVNFGPATTNWGSIGFVALEDDIAGKMIWYGVAVPPRVITDGLPFQIAAGQIQLRLN